MHTDRLLLLADRLDTVPPEEFDIGVFKCKTVACALGHAAMMPEFQALGLVLGKMTYEHFGNMLEFHHDGTTHFRAEAAQFFFDLTREQVYSLFFSSGYRHMHGRVHPNPKPAPSDVAAKIRDFVAKHKEN